MNNEFVFEKENNQSLREMAYMSMRRAIIKGDLKAGQRLIEMAMSEQMGMSRGPIREALRQLEHEGLVISTAYRETVVAEVSEEEVENILVPIRLIAECYAAKKACTIFTKANYDYLNKLVDLMSMAVTKQDLDSFSEYDLQFHEYILERSEITSLITIWKSIVGKIYIRIFLQGYQRKNLEEVIKEHSELIQLIREGNTEGIDRHLKAHIF